MAQHPRFDAAIATLADSGIINIERRITYILAPVGVKLRAEIIARARGWNCQKEPEIEYITMSDKLAVELKRQMDIDIAEAGPKAPYDELEYCGVSLQSRFSVASEFKTMKVVIDAMASDVRLRIASIWCDSRACADYQVEVTLGMDHSDLPNQIRQYFLIAGSGFNGLTVNQGANSKIFDPEWPGDEEFFDHLAEA